MNGCYDPDTGEIFAESTYSLFHEYEHQSQHASRGILWQARAARFPVIPFVANVLLEILAAARAVTLLWSTGILESEDVIEAVYGVLTYVFFA